MVISTLRHLTSVKYRLHVCMRPTPEPRQCAGWRPRAAPSAWPGSPPECPSGTSSRLCSAALCHLRRSDCNCSAFLLLLLLCRCRADTTYLHICSEPRLGEEKATFHCNSQPAGFLTSEWRKPALSINHIWCYQYLDYSFLLRVTVKINNKLSLWWDGVSGMGFDVKWSPTKHNLHFHIDQFHSWSGLFILDWAHEQWAYSLPRTVGRSACLHSAVQCPLCTVYPQPS